MRRPFLFLILLVVLAAPLQAQVMGSAPGQPLMEVPGGVAELSQRLGIGGHVLRAQIPLTAIRLLWEVPVGADPASDKRRVETLAYLGGAGVEGLQTGQASDLVPAVLPPEAWSVLLGEAGAGRALFTSILADREAALLYYGLASLDPPTRQYLLAHPKLLGDLRDRRRAAVFATLGRSFRVRRHAIGNPVKGGQDSRSHPHIEVPGGAEAVPLWEAVAEERASDPAGFMLAVLQKDQGRLALLYDGIAHLDEGARRFALGLHLPPANRLERFQELYDATGAALHTWDPGKRPFERMPFDAVHLLLSAPFDAGGTLRGPGWPGFWKSVFLPIVTDGPRAVNVTELAAEAPLDAAALVKSLCVKDSGERRVRSETWLFAARVFPDVSLADAADVLVALRGFSRYPSLLLALERMGISSPATYATAARAAARLAAADHRLVQFQSAIAMIERASAARAIDARAAETLVRALCDATPPDGGEYGGAVARWLERDFLGSVPEAVVPAGLAPAGRPLEFRVLAAMAGSVASAPNAALLALPPVEWEGLTYRLDPAGSTLRRLVLVRARQGGYALDAVLSVARLAGAIAAATSAAAARAAAEQLPDAVATLHDEPGAAAVRGAPADAERLAGLVARTLRDVKGLQPDPDANRLARIARPLMQAVDLYLADVMRSLAYAPILGEPDAPALLAGDPSRAHDLRFFKERSELGRRTAWEPAVEARDARLGWHLSGSLLGLDLAAGRLALRRLFRETIPETPRLADAVRQAFTETALLVTPFELGEASRDALLAAVEGGRARVRQLGPSSAAIERLAAETGLDEWRTEALRWTLDHEPDRRLELFSLAELARAGGFDEASVPGADAWGTTGLARDRGLTLSFPPQRFWTTISGRRGVAAAAALVPDLTIGLAESSARLGLPAAATAGLLLVATQEFIDTLRTTHADDWLAIVAHAQAVARDGVEDYVAGLTITGPLVPLEK
ncbi:MAG TPA: hypothetical protein VK911_10735 [Vicinamibacterales bacterium]|nr:hypothetical protein [Vicinamibacterales bacterium]